MVACLNMWRNRALVLDFFSDFGDFFERNISQNIFEMNILHNMYFLKLIITNFNSKIKLFFETTKKFTLQSCENK